MVVSKRSTWLITGGLLFIAVGVLLSATWPTIFHAKIQQMMVLKNDSTSYDIWKALPIPIYMECFLFNITNVDDILAGKDVLVELKEMGPYVFREINRKVRIRFDINNQVVPGHTGKVLPLGYTFRVNITWNANSTVTFRNQRFWYFQPEMSSGSLSDNITTINPIIATIAYTLRNDRMMLKIFVDMVLRAYHTNMFVTANASAWLFDGVPDPVLDLVGKIPALPYTIPFDRFGWFYKRNGSIDADGLFSINTGEADFSKLGKMERWQNSNRSIYREQCGHVQGSAGELWNLETDQQEISIFAADLCTHMTLPYSGKVVKHGIEGVEFTSNDSLFDNGHKYPEQACYCDESRGVDCMPAGAFNVSGCKYGAPAVVTLPHLQGLEPYYPSKIRGLKPLERHRFRMSIEPVTGMPLAISAQLQANALVRHVPGISLNNQLPDPDTLLPMFWFREDIEVDGEYVDFAKAALGVRYGLPYGLYAFVIIGICLIVSGVYKIRRFAIPPQNEADNDASKKFLGTQAR